jgi:hypothetical protein
VSVIGTDKPLPNELIKVLNSVLDAMIPARSDGRPSAADIGLADKLDEMPAEQIEQLSIELSRVDAIEGFCNLPLDRRLSLLDDLRQSKPGFLQGLAGFATSHYYRDDRVLEAIGIDARAPFPEGYEVEPGDLSLLDPVKARGQIYRDA